MGCGASGSVEIIETSKSSAPASCAKEKTSGMEIVPSKPLVITADTYMSREDARVRRHEAMREKQRRSSSNAQAISDKALVEQERLSISTRRSPLSSDTDNSSTPSRSDNISKNVPAVTESPREDQNGESHLHDTAEEDGVHFAQEFADGGGLDGPKEVSLPVRSSGATTPDANAGKDESIKKNKLELREKVERKEELISSEPVDGGGMVGDGRTEGGNAEHGGNSILNKDASNADIQNKGDEINHGDRKNVGNIAEYSSPEDRTVLNNIGNTEESVDQNDIDGETLVSVGFNSHSTQQEVANSGQIARESMNAGNSSVEQFEQVTHPGGRNDDEPVGAGGELSDTQDRGIVGSRGEIQQAKETNIATSPRVEEGETSPGYENNLGDSQRTEVRITDEKNHTNEDKRTTEVKSEGDSKSALGSIGSVTHCASDVDPSPAGEGALEQPVDGTSRDENNVIDSSAGGDYRTVGMESGDSYKSSLPGPSHQSQGGQDGNTPIAGELRHEGDSGSADEGSLDHGHGVKVPVRAGENLSWEGSDEGVADLDGEDGIKCRVSDCCSIRVS